MTPAELRRIAEAATPGPWELDKCDNRVHVDYVRAPNDENLIAPICSVSSPGPNAEFIATFNPQRVLELLDEIDQLRADVSSTEEMAADYNEEIVASHARLAAVEKIADAIEEHDAPFEAFPAAQWIRKVARGE